MKFLLMTSLLAVISLIVVGCSSTQDLRYLESRAAEKLEVPPDLTVTNFGVETKLPSNFSSDADDSKPLNGVPVLLKVDSVQLEGRADFYWLSVDEPVDNLFQLVKSFWASEGFKIALDEPAIGLLETDWVYQKEGADKPDVSFLVKLFSTDDLSATQNQFRTRVERDVKTGKSLIYIAHRGTAYDYVFRSAQTGERNLEDRDPSNTDWQLTPPNSEFEVEMLSRLMIYLGLQQAELDQQLGNIKLFSSLASIHADYSKNETYLLVKDSYSKTWYRTLHQLDRMNMKVVRSDFKVGVGFRAKGAIYVETKVEEIKKSGFFSFGSETETVKKQIILIIAEEGSGDNISRISMETPGGEIESSDDGVEFLTLLYQNLK
jgi:outer membrane protein assembly factor BamC